MGSKNIYICYFLLIVFPLFAFHRFYLGQWKAGILFIFMILFPLLLRDILAFTGVSLSDGANKLYIICGFSFWAGLIIWEAIRLPKTVETRNNE